MGKLNSSKNKKEPISIVNSTNYSDDLAFLQQPNKGRHRSLLTSQQMRQATHKALEVEAENRLTAHKSNTREMQQHFHMHQRMKSHERLYSRKIERKILTFKANQPGLDLEETEAIGSLVGTQGTQ